MNNPITMVPIGVVHNDIPTADAASAPTRRGSTKSVPWEHVISRIEVAADLTPALEGVEAFSHLLVIFAFDRRPEGPGPLQVHPQGRSELPLVGVLATRSPRRPNPIAITVVELLEREGNVLTVRGLDALDGTPVLDLKPYLPRGAPLQAVRVPAWVKQLGETHDRENENG